MTLHGAGGARWLAGTTAAVAAADLAHTALAVAAGPVAANARSAAYGAIALLLGACWAAAVLMTGSALVAAAAGIVLGGALGNVTALLLWPSVAGVPDPIRWGEGAFNLGDVAILAGVPLTVAAAVLFALRDPERLRRPVPS